MAERSNAAVLKTVVQQCTRGSNPFPSAGRALFERALFLCQQAVRQRVTMGCGGPIPSLLFRGVLIIAAKVRAVIFAFITSRL